VRLASAGNDPQIEGEEIKIRRLHRLRRSGFEEGRATELKNCVYDPTPRCADACRSDQMSEPHP
jgi:hypothetical protein